MFNHAAEFLKTEVAVLNQVCRGQAFADTLVPRKRNRLDVVITRADGTVERMAPIFNSRVDAGANWQASLMGSAAGTPANYLALSATSLTIAKGDTALSGEITTNGLGRVQATYGSYTAPSSLSGAASYQLTHTFTATGPQTVNSAALFNASSAGTMFVEANLTSTATLASGDSLAITWTVNI